VSDPYSSPLASSIPSRSQLEDAWNALRDLEQHLAEEIPEEIRVGCVHVLEQCLPDPARPAGPAPSSATPLQWAAALFAEQFVLDVANVTDEMTAALAERWDSQQLYAFVCWLQAAEAARRAALTLRHEPSGRFR
jgi:hypothetical protein